MEAGIGSTQTASRVGPTGYYQNLQLGMHAARHERVTGLRVRARGQCGLWRWTACIGPACVSQPNPGRRPGADTSLVKKKIERPVHRVLPCGQDPTDASSSSSAPASPHARLRHIVHTISPFALSSPLSSSASPSLLPSRSPPATLPLSRSTLTQTAVHARPGTL